MNPAYLHLVLNHLPLLGSFSGFVILMYGGWRNSVDLIRVGMAFLVFAGVVTVPVYHSGHGAAKVAEDLIGVSNPAIQHHRHAAEISYYLGIALGVAGVWGLIEQRRRGQLSRWLIVVIGVLTGAVFVSLLITTRAGLSIRHPEIEIPPRNINPPRTEQLR